ncbi:HNH endonuclease [Mucilaginibacter dorajii]|uniref:HNH nuclease domain-containing protein n=1 Tax=Mucilaginibacter dorajii TaxID=692994 RepID=A0ABP7PUK4_9SPHI|nr:HNH endonuclease [Mucilaginibacter dorajii]MCS3735011.1 hypothetical protein [Mucilaginibacter dorajii]
MSYLINGKRFEIIDTIEKIPSRDSFTDEENKIGKSTGAWEWHIGSKRDAAKYAFFGGLGFDALCFIKKDDLIWLMEELQPEYQDPSQNYRGKLDFLRVYKNRMDQINSLASFSFFHFREHDQRDSLDNRLYAKRPGSKADGDDIYSILRDVALPNLTFTSILKLQSSDGQIMYYFKVFPNFSSYDWGNNFSIAQESAILSSITISTTEKDQLIKARVGQGKFRMGISKECKICPITRVDDTRLLVASHIKPWSLSSNFERLDPKNGVLFTPTIDKLFDSGFISFTDHKELIVSPWISQNTTKKLNLLNGTRYTHFPIKGREKYIEYHRHNIFKS